MSWNPPDLWAAIAALDADPEAQAALVDAWAVFPGGAPIRPTMSVRAPCCGRKTSADDVLDLRGVPNTVFRATDGLNRAPTDHDWACNACWTAFTRDPDGKWTRSRLFRQLGAPAHVIRANRAQEMVAMKRRKAAREDRPCNRGEEMRWALGELPVNVSALPGTDPPP